MFPTLAGVLLLIFQLNNYSHQHNNEVNPESQDWDKKIREELANYNVSNKNENDSHHKGHHHGGHYHEH